MSITSVRFSVPVAVVKGEAHIEWKPGERGVRSVASYPHGMLAFIFDECIREVIAPPGTVIETDGDWIGQPTASGVLPRCQQCGTTGGAHAAECPTVTQPTLGTVLQKAVSDGPTSNQVGEEPPPARPIPKSKRIQR